MNTPSPTATAAGSRQPQACCAPRSDGFVLLAVLALLLTVAAISLLLTEESGMEVALVRMQSEQDSVRYAAEAGLKHAHWQLDQNLTCANYSELAAVPFGTHSYAATVTPSNGSPVTLSAVATLADGTSRTLTRSDVKTYQTKVTLVLQPDAAAGKDNYIFESQPARNFGANANLLVEDRYTDSWSNALLEFDLSAIPAAATIIAATLDLYQNLPAASGGDFAIHRITSPWVEGTQTNTDGAPNWTESEAGTDWMTVGGDYDATPAATLSIPAGVGAQRWELADLVRQWVSGASANLGMAIVPASSGSNASFTSSDTTNQALLSQNGQRPTLTVTYACECGLGSSAGSMVLQPDGAAAVDGYAAEQSPTFNYGTTSMVQVNTAGGSVKTPLLKFDLADLPSGAVINSAQLDLYLAYVTAGSGTIAAHRMLQPWMEGIGDNWQSGDGATWTTSNGSSAWSWPGNYDAAATAQTPLGAGGSWHSWNITALVSAWQAGDYGNEGLALVGSGSIADASFYSSDTTAPQRPRLLLSYTCPCSPTCGASTSGGNLLMVVDDPDNLATQDVGKKMLIESWGYSVTLIDDGANQSVFDAAAAAADVAYVSATAADSMLQTELVDTAIGVVSEHAGLVDEFGFSSASSSATRDSLDIANNDHYITAGFPLGSLTIHGSPQASYALTGTIAPGLTTLANDPGGAPGLATLDRSASLDGGGAAAGRRVKLPWGGSTFDHALMNNAGRAIMQRAIEWAAAPDAGAPPVEYVEAFQEWNASQAGVWQTQDLAGYGVPANVVAEVAISSDNPNFERWVGVRAVGSSLERRLQLQEAEAGGVDAVVMHVQTNGTAQIQHYAETAGEEIAFTLLGYWTGGSYVERYDAFAASAASWQAANLAPYGVGANNVAEIVIANSASGNERLAGVRSVGSSLDRRLEIHEAEAGGADMATMLVNTDGTANAAIEIAAEDPADIAFYLVGYWNTPPGTYTEAAATVLDPSSLSGAWTPANAAAHGVPPFGVAQVAVTNGDSGAEAELGHRETGSSQQRVLDLKEAEGGGRDIAVWHVNVDGSAAGEWYDESAGDTHEFRILGWWQ